MPLFSTDPNTCAKDFNDLLIAEVGKQHVIPLYSIFLDHDRSRSLNIDTSNRKLFKADGLHPNKGGSKMISGAIVKFLHCNEGTNPALVTASAVTHSRIVPTGVSTPSVHGPPVQRLRQSEQKRKNQKQSPRLKSRLPVPLYVFMTKTEIRNFQGLIK